MNVLKPSTKLMYCAIVNISFGVRITTQRTHPFRAPAQALPAENWRCICN
eukprot:COSAG02_NODE_45748_length_354_cov_0.968627_1_plen_49_part_10